MNDPHHLTATIDALIALSVEMTAARRWDEVKTLQTAAMQLSAMRDADLGHPLFGRDGDFDAAGWARITD